MNKQKFFLGVSLLTVLFFIAGSGISNIVCAGESQDTLQFGCMSDGSVFKNIVPKPSDLRKVKYLTPFGTLNTNIIFGEKVNGAVAARVSDLSERIGEFMMAVNSSALITQMSIVDKNVPLEYLKERTLVLCGGPADNKLVKQLVTNGKSKVDWTKSKTGTIEIIPHAFGGQASAIIAGGTDNKGIVMAIEAMTGFFAHLAGSNLAENGLLNADLALRHKNIFLASKGIERMLDGLRLDGSTKIFIPVRNFTPEFPGLLKAEGKTAQNYLRFLRKNPSVKEADEGFRRLAGFCAYCHMHYLSYDRSAQNRNRFHYAQFPKTRCETKWVRIYTLQDGKIVKKINE